MGVSTLRTTKELTIVTPAHGAPGMLARRASR